MKKYRRFPYYRLGVSWKFSHFAVRSKHWTIHISILAILNWTEQYKQFCRSMLWLSRYFVQLKQLCLSSNLDLKTSTAVSRTSAEVHFEPSYINHYCKMWMVGHWPMSVKLHSLVSDPKINFSYVHHKMCVWQINDCRGNSYNKHVYCKYSACTVCERKSCLYIPVVINDSDERFSLVVVLVEVHLLYWYVGWWW